MTKEIWRTGPPPSQGWWHASASPYPNMLRWWNGRYWSRGVMTTDDIKFAASQAKRKAIFDQGLIKWKPRPKWWPERSRT